MPGATRAANTNTALLTNRGTACHLHHLYQSSCKRHEVPNPTTSSFIGSARDSAIGVAGVLVAEDTEPEDTLMQKGLLALDFGTTRMKV